MICEQAKVGNLSGFWTTLMIYGKEARVLPDEFMDVDPLTDDDCTRRQKRRPLLYADVESISSDSLIGDVESMEEDPHEESDIVLLKGEMSSKDHSERKESNDGETRQKANPLNADLELHKSLGPKPLHEDHHRVFSTSWPSQPIASGRSGLQLPLNSKILKFWQQKDLANQNAGSSVFQKRKTLGTKVRSFKLIKFEKEEPRTRERKFVEVEADQDWEIKKIVDIRDTEEGREYKVVWAITWVNEKDLTNATSLISEFRDAKRVKFST